MATTITASTRTATTTTTDHRRSADTSALSIARRSSSGVSIGALSDRVSELTKRVGSLESELDSAHKRVAVYEEFDATVRDALSGALRAAHEIRARAENAAQQILEQARDERKMLIKEI